MQAAQNEPSGDSGATSPSDGAFFGHPGGLATLFFTEMWERFSYYGMRAILTLYLTAAITSADGSPLKNPGMGLDATTAGAIYGLYTSFVYLLSLPGGWVADNLWGQRKAVYVGGWIIMLGHFTMAIPTDLAFFAGLILIILGTGLLKPSVSTVVADLYPEGGARRDAGFSIFYMGINVGAFAGPLVAGTLGEGFNWHWGFAAAGFGMALGLVQYVRGLPAMGNAGLLKTERSPEETAALGRRFWTITGVVLAAIAVFGFLVSNGTLGISLTEVATYLGYSVIVIVFAYFFFLVFFGGHSGEEIKRLLVILWLFVLIAIFWSGFEQAGTSLNLFARDLTDRVYFGWEMPASYLQSVNSIFIILLAPVFGFLWSWLARRNANPSIPVKFGLGLLGLSAGFFVLAWGAANASVDDKVSPTWLVVTYFLHTVGELAISPVGLSAMTKLAPANRVGQMMGIWFVGAALGNLIAGLVSGYIESMEPAILFSTVAMGVGGVGVIAVIVSPGVRALMGKVN